MKILNAETTQALAGRLKAVQRTDVAHWGRMSAAEMLCHLSGAFRAATGDLPVLPAPPPPYVPPALLKYIALRIPLRWPRHVPTVAELKLGTAAMCVGDFDEDRRAALLRLQAFAGHDALQKEHPIFGGMSRADWMRWAYLHTDHHLRQFGR